MYNKGAMPGLGYTSMSIRDKDGSLLRRAGSSAVTKGVYYATPDKCTDREDWNMQVCTEHYGKVNKSAICMHNK